MPTPSSLEPRLYTLDELSSRLGTPDPETLAALTPHDEKDALIRLGAEIKSSRILIDESRIYSLAYEVFSRATPSQKLALVGFSNELLAVAVFLAVALRKLTAEMSDEAHDDKAEVAERAVVARELVHRAQARREQAYTVLRSVIGGDAKLRAQLDAAARGAVDGGEELSRKLERTAELGRTLFAHKDDAVAARIGLARLTPAFFAELDGLAKELREATRAATARAAVKRASQGELDLLDGVNLTMLGDVVRLFEVAHDLDRSIPRLLPIATRRLLGKRTATVKSVPASPGDAPAAG